MAEKQLLIEASEFGLICNLSNDEKNRLTEDCYKYYIKG